jgi:NAD(P)-dependent dehydrogenase (short-subunit alcohol dehydrogenase family)
MESRAVPRSSRAALAASDWPPRDLAKAGAHGVLLDLPSSQGVRVAASFGGSTTFAAADVTVEDGVRAAFDAAESVAQDRVVVNCAGVGAPERVLAEDGAPTPLASIRKIPGVYSLGSCNVLRLGAERMLRAATVGEERGVVVNIASVAAFDGRFGQAACSASKGDIVGMTLPFARGPAQHGIRVVTIAPGPFNTPLLAMLPEPTAASLGAQVPHPSRLGEPVEYAALVEHVVGNAMLNGEVIRLDGRDQDVTVLMPGCVRWRS